jgi:hypothetical protein
VPAAEARHDRVLKVHKYLAQALAVIDKPLVLAELILNLLKPRFDLVNDHADVRTSRHLTPALDSAGSQSTATLPGTELDAKESDVPFRVPPGRSPAQRPGCPVCTAFAIATADRR